MGFTAKAFGVSGLALVMLLVAYAMVYAASVQIGAMAYENETVGYGEGMEEIDSVWDNSEERANDSAGERLIWSYGMNTFFGPMPHVMRAGYSVGYRYPAMARAVNIVADHLVVAFIIWIGYRGYRFHKRRRPY